MTLVSDADRTIRVERANLTDPDDVRDVVSMLEMYAHDAMGLGGSLGETVRERLVGALPKAANSVGFLARAASGGEPPRAVGVACCLVNLATFDGLPFVNVHDLAVSEELRGGGVGRRLLAAVEGYARSIGACKVTLEVRVDNPRAMGLYRSLGFGPGAVTHEYWTRRLVDRGG